MFDLIKVFSISKFFYMTFLGPVPWESLNRSIRNGVSAYSSLPTHVFDWVAAAEIKVGLSVDVCYKSVPAEIVKMLEPRLVKLVPSTSIFMRIYFKMRRNLNNLSSFITTLWNAGSVREKEYLGHWRHWFKLKKWAQIKLISCKCFFRKKNNWVNKDVENK